MKTKRIRAVQLIRRIRDAHYERLKGTIPAERIAFYREKAQSLHKKWRISVESQDGKMSNVVRNSGLGESR